MEAVSSSKAAGPVSGSIEFVSILVHFHRRSLNPTHHGEVLLGKISDTTYMQALYLSENFVPSLVKALVPSVIFKLQI